MENQSRSESPDFVPLKKECSSINLKQNIFNKLRKAGFDKDHTIKDDYDECIGGIIFLLKKYYPGCQLQFKSTTTPGQRIKQSAGLKNDLKTVKCPHQLLEWQCIGLDYKAFMQVVTWLVEKIQSGEQYETSIVRKSVPYSSSLISTSRQNNFSQFSNLITENNDDNEWQKKYFEIYEKFAQAQVQLEEMQAFGLINENDEETIMYQEKLQEVEEKRNSLQQQLDNQVNLYEKVLQEITQIESNNQELENQINLYKSTAQEKQEEIEKYREEKSNYEKEVQILKESLMEQQTQNQSKQIKDSQIFQEELEKKDKLIKELENNQKNEINQFLVSQNQSDLNQSKFEEKTDTLNQQLEEATKLKSSIEILKQEMKQNKIDAQKKIEEERQISQRQNSEQEEQIKRLKTELEQAQIIIQKTNTPFVRQDNYTNENQATKHSNTLSSLESTADERQQQNIQQADRQVKNGNLTDAQQNLDQQTVQVQEKNTAHSYVLPQQFENSAIRQYHLQNEKDQQDNCEVCSAKCVIF